MMPWYAEHVETVEVPKVPAMLEKLMMECVTNGKGLGSAKTKTTAHVHTNTLGINGVLIGNQRAKESPKERKEKVRMEKAKAKAKAKA